MKVKISTIELLTGLKKISSVASNNKIIEILNNVYIETVKERIKLIGSNLDVRIETFIQGNIFEEGSFTIPCQKLIQIAGVLKKDVTIAIDRDSNMVEVSEGKSKMRIPGIEGLEFPSEPKFEKNTFIELPAAIVIEGFKKAMSCIANISGQPTSGVLLVILNQKVEFCGIDGSRMFVYSVTIDVTNEVNVIVPPFTIRELLKIAKPIDDIKIIIDRGTVVFIIGDTKITSTVLSGAFPPYNQVIPKQLSHEIVIDKEQLILVVQKARILKETLQNATAGGIKFTTQKNQLLAQFRSSNGDLNEEIECQCNEGISVILNPEFLLDALQNFSDSKIKLSIGSPVTPILITSEKDSTCLYLQAPMDPKVVQK